MVLYQSSHKMEINPLFNNSNKFESMVLLYSNVSPLRISCLSTSDENRWFAKSVDLDEVAHNQPSHLDLDCLPFSL